MDLNEQTLEASSGRWRRRMRAWRRWKPRRPTPRRGTRAPARGAGGRGACTGRRAARADAHPLASGGRDSPDVIAGDLGRGRGVPGRACARAADSAHQLAGLGPAGPRHRCRPRIRSTGRLRLQSAACRRTGAVKREDHVDGKTYEVEVEVAEEPVRHPQAFMVMPSQAPRARPRRRPRRLRPTLARWTRPRCAAAPSPAPSSASSRRRGRASSPATSCSCSRR